MESHNLEPDKYALYLLNKFGSFEAVEDYLRETGIIIDAMPIGSDYDRVLVKFKHMLIDTKLEILRMKYGDK